MVMVGLVLLARRSQQQFPPPVLVSITQSNAPFSVFPGGDNGVFFIMPDGTLWQWGRPGSPQSPRAVVPEQVGTEHDWVKVVGAGTHCLGLRSDGTIWGWGFSNGRYAPEPQPAIQGNEWIDIGTGLHHAAGIKRDGTLWTWHEPLVANGGKAEPGRQFHNAGFPPQVGRASPSTTVVPGNNWVAVYCGNQSTSALQRDGTLWVDGYFSRSLSGGWSTVFVDPTRLCAETNWTGLSADGLASNKAGELWDVKYANPNPASRAAEVCSLVSSDWTADRVHSTPVWTQTQIRAGGTLWTVHLVPSTPPLALADDWRQLGARSDWVAAWGEGPTGFGLTADGTVWTWGVELGQEPVKTYETRLELLRQRLTGGLRPGAGRFPRQTLPRFVAQPRPLLKLVDARANQQRK
jgi:hypothetical protein